MRLSIFAQPAVSLEFNVYSRIYYERDAVKSEINLIILQFPAYRKIQL